MTAETPSSVLVEVEMIDDVVVTMVVSNVVVVAKVPDSVVV